MPGGCSIYWDAPHGIILYHGIHPIACLAFEIMGSVIITQLQGVTGRSGGDELKGLRWERFLVRVVKEVAVRLRYKQIQINPGRRNPWWNPYRAKNFKIRYDVTAQREGFKLDQGLDMYVYEPTGG